jgi:hypothetical protein
MVPVVWPAESILQNDGAHISSAEFATRYEVASFSKSERFTGNCLVIGYAYNPAE